MKILLFSVTSAFILLFTLPIAYAQKDTTKKAKVIININIGGSKIFSHSKKDSVAKIDSTENERFFSGITFTRLDFGFSKLVDNNSFALSPSNQFLDYRSSKTSHISFDVLQLGYRFTPQFKFYLSAGFDWTIIRLRQNITMQKNMSTLNYINEPVVFSKNRFSSSYLHIPLNFEYRTKRDKNGNRFYVVASPEIGFLLNAKVKQITTERGKQKEYDDYNFAPFRFGCAFRMGYDGIGVFAKYYATDMFDSAPQKGLKNMAFGVTFGLN